MSTGYHAIAQSFFFELYYTGNQYERTCRLQNLFFDIVFLNTNLPQTCLVEWRMLFMEAKFHMVVWYNSFRLGPFLNILSVN
jgi:hypothetical protein